MTAETNDLVQGHLDGVLTPEQAAELNAWVKQSPAHAHAFVRAALLHDRLRNELRAMHEIRSVPGEASTRADPAARSRRANRWRSLTALASLAAAVALALGLSLWLLRPAPLSAATELERLIDTPALNRDRTYRIRSLDMEPERADGRRPPLDGAVLHVRPPDRYVLVRYFPDGTKFVTGSDGERSWAIRAGGPVRVSGDPLRFRGPLPGHQHGVPFADLRSDLVRLRDAYRLSALAPQPNGWRGLGGERKTSATRGPKRVELWYDPNTLVIHRMVFDGLPQAQGGPRRVAAELVEQRDLGADFFQHETHHAADRRVIEED